MFFLISIRLITFSLELKDLRVVLQSRNHIQMRAASSYRPDPRGIAKLIAFVPILSAGSHISLEAI